MDIVLVFPPLADPTQPYSSLPALTAALGRRGWRNILQLDLNIELCQRMLTRSGMRRAVTRVHERLEHLSREPSRGQGPSSPAAATGRLLRAMMVGAHVIEHIDAAAAELHRPECYDDPGRLNEARRTVLDAIEVLSAASDPVRMDPAGAPSRHLRTLDQVAAAVAEPGNLIHEHLELEVLPRLEELAPAVLGISITYPSQMAASFALAEMVRDRLPDTAIVLGGQQVSQWRSGLSGCPELFNWCDFIISHEGETPLHRLCVAVVEGRPIDAIPNLAWRAGGRVRVNPVMVESIAELATPDYRGLPLDSYLTPEPVLLVSASRGCYWGRCAFCAVSPAMRGTYRARSAQAVANDISTLAERHHTGLVSFGDDCLSPEMLRRLADALPRAGAKLAWQGEVRFEPELRSGLLERLRRSGCTNLVFGLESYSPRMLKRMSKGIAHSEIGRILEDCRRQGIAFNLQLFFGFPGETTQDAEATTDFVIRQAHGAATFSFGTFALMRGSDAARRPEAYGIERIDRGRGCLAVSHDFAPEAEHATRARERLRDELRLRARYPHLGLSLTAQTLVYFARHGTGDDLYRSAPATPAGAPDELELRSTRWTHGPDVRVIPVAELPDAARWFLTHRGHADDLKDGGSSRGNGHELLLYDRRQDRIARVSRLALWVLQHLDGSVTPAELEPLLAEACPSEEHLQQAAASMHAAIAELAVRGILSAPV